MAQDPRRTEAKAAVKAAVKASLARLVEVAPGRSVEVRVPPYAAVQAVGGTTHRRGTPPALVETDAETWLALAEGRLGWHEAVAAGRVRASGERSDLSAYLPLSAEPRGPGGTAPESPGSGGAESQVPPDPHG
jgi:hypothetical protein